MRWRIGLFIIVGNLATKLGLGVEQPIFLTRTSPPPWHRRMHRFWSGQPYPSMKSMASYLAATWMLRPITWCAVIILSPAFMIVLYDIEPNGFTLQQLAFTPVQATDSRVWRCYSM